MAGEISANWPSHSATAQQLLRAGAFGTFKRGGLAKVFEDATFPLKSGEYTDPIRTKQGFVIFKVDQHIAGGVPAFKDVEQDVEQNYYEGRMEPAMRAYLTPNARKRLISTPSPALLTRDRAQRRSRPRTASTRPFSEKEEEGGAHAIPRETARTFRRNRHRPNRPQNLRQAAPATKKDVNATVQKPGKKGKDSLWQGAYQDAAECRLNSYRGCGSCPDAGCGRSLPIRWMLPNLLRKTRFSARRQGTEEEQAKGPPVG